MSTKIFVVLYGKWLWLLGGKFHKDFLQCFGLEQGLQRHITKPRPALFHQHLAVFHFLLVVHIPVDVNDFLRARGLLFTLEYLNLFVRDYEGERLLTIIHGHIALKLAVKLFWIARVVVFSTPLCACFIELFELLDTRLPNGSRSLGWENREVALAPQIVDRNLDRMHRRKMNLASLVDKLILADLTEQPAAKTPSQLQLVRED